jgi:type IX secretion system PorP/SprF family membrane protein
MKEDIVFFAIAIFLGVTTQLKGQVYQYAQYYAAPVWLNPAHVGLVDEVEITVQYRESKLSGYQFPSLSVAYPFFNKTTQAKRGGFGMGLAQEQFGPDKIYVITQWIGGFSYNLPIATHHFISVGLQGGLVNRKVDLNKVTTDNQYLFGSFDPGRPPGENFVNTSTNIATINSGVSWSMTDEMDRQKAYLGVAFLGMNAPRAKLLRDAVRDRAVYSISGAVSVPVRGTAFTWLPNFRWIIQGNLSFANLGQRLHYTFGPGIPSFIGVGVWYNTNKIAVSNLEYGTNRFLLALAYNGNLAKTASMPNVSNAWEVAFTWRIKRNTAGNRTAIKEASPSQEEPRQREASVVKLNPTEIQKQPPTVVHEQQVPVSSPAEQQQLSAATPVVKDSLLTKEEMSIFQRKVGFALNSYAVDKGGHEFLDSLAHVLKTHPEIHIKITGHTCTIGSKSANFTVSQKRAQSVKAALMRKGVAPTQLQAVGMDFQRPLNANKTEAERAKNRRVEFEILKH